MKKIIIILIFAFTIFSTNIIYGAETEEIIGGQEEALGISGFIKQAEKYTSESFEIMDVGDLYKEAISGDIKAEGLVRKHFKNTWKRSYKNNNKSWIHINHYNNT